MSKKLKPEAGGRTVEPLVRCSNCFWYGEDEEEVGNGGIPISYCHRFPPIMVTDDYRDGDFPSVYADLWCGEFKARTPNVTPQWRSARRGPSVHWRRWLEPSFL